MAELLKTRCGQGQLIITEQHIRVELPGEIKKTVMDRSALVGINAKQGIPPIFGIGGSTDLEFCAASGDHLRVTLVARKVAKQITDLLGY